MHQAPQTAPNQRTPALQLLDLQSVLQSDVPPLHVGLLLVALQVEWDYGKVAIV